MIPQGGLFIWLKLPDGVSAEELLPAAERKGVRFAPGGQFFPERTGGDAYIRLNFAASTEAEIDSGIRRLGDVIRSFV